MSSADYFISGVLIFFEAICTFLFFSIFMQKRYENKWWGNVFSMSIVYTVVAMFVINAVRAWPVPFIVNIVSVIIFILVNMLFFVGSLKIKLFLSIVMQLLLVGIDSLVVFVYMQFGGNTVDVILNNSLSFFLLGTIGRVLLFMAVLVSMRIWKRFQTTRESVFAFNEWIMLLLPPIITIMTIFTFLWVIGPESAYINLVMICVIGLLFTSPILLHLFQSVLERNSKENELQLLKSQQAGIKDGIGATVAIVDAQRGIMHDIKEKLATVDQLLVSGYTDKAHEYITGLKEKVNANYFHAYTNHNLIDAVLNQFRIASAVSGISFQVISEPIGEIPVEDDDIVTILANLLRNAVDACENVSGNKLVRVAVTIVGNDLVLAVRNSIPKRVLIKKDNHIETTKPDKMSHGIGLLNVAATLQKYHAGYALDSTDTEFVFSTAVRIKSE